MPIVPNNVRYVPDLFTFVNKMKTRNQMVAALREFKARNSPQVSTLRGVIRYTFHPEIELKLPEGIPPFNIENAFKYDYTNAPNNLLNGMKRYISRMSDQSPRFISKPMQREKLYINLLESMCGPETELLLRIKLGSFTKPMIVGDRKMPGWSKLDESLFAEAFPEWFEWLEDEDDPNSTGSETIMATKSPATSSTEEDTPQPKKPTRKRANTNKSAPYGYTKSGKPRGKPGPKPKSE